MWGDLIETISGSMPKVLEKTMTDTLHEHDLDNETQENIVHAKKKFFPHKIRKGQSRAKKYVSSAQGF